MHNTPAIAGVLCFEKNNQKWNNGMLKYIIIIAAVIYFLHREYMQYLVDKASNDFKNGIE